MAWKTCPTCKEEIAHTADRCPKCGHKFMGGCCGCIIVICILIIGFFIAMKIGA